MKNAKSSIIADYQAAFLFTFRRNRQTHIAQNAASFNILNFIFIDDYIVTTTCK